MTVKHEPAVNIRFLVLMFMAGFFMGVSFKHCTYLLIRRRESGRIINIFASFGIIYS